MGGSRRSVRIMTLARWLNNPPNLKNEPRISQIYSKEWGRDMKGTNRKRTGSMGWLSLAVAITAAGVLAYAHVSRAQTTVEACRASRILQAGSIFWANGSACLYFRRPTPGGVYIKAVFRT